MQESDSNLTELILSCTSIQEAQKVSDKLMADGVIQNVEMLGSEINMQVNNHQSNVKDIKLILHVNHKVVDAVRAKVSELSPSTTIN